MFSNESIDIDTLPDFAPLEYEPMAEQAPIEQLIGWSITFLIIGIVAAAFGILFNFPNPLLISIGVGFIALVAYVVFYIFASHKKRGIAVREQDILYKRGLIWRTTTIIPFSRIQHIETQRGLFERQLGLATLKIFSAGGLSSDLVISGLTVMRASQLRQLILEKANSESLTDD